ncbi:tRNA(m5U54)methyltransferase [Toensbergia leucococca]|nr:tRNA(m5U54)methyltransferase [Toensbergia leucococca]
MTRKKNWPKWNHSSKRQKGHFESTQTGSNEEVLLADVEYLLSSQRKATPLGSKDTENETHLTPESSFSPPEKFSEVEVRISEISSTGDGLGLSSNSDHVFVVPFTVPGDLVKAKVINYFQKQNYTITDFVAVVEPAKQRNDALIRCPYFSRCGGCQLQMLSYEDQLAHKKSIIEKAYRNFSALTPEVVPAVGETIGSPLQYGYRTKLTPHFDGPPGSLRRRGKRDGEEDPKFSEVPPIGFNLKGTRKTIDIEECPIATDAVVLGLGKERERVARELSRYRRGATLLLRENTTRRYKNLPGNDHGSESSTGDEEAIQALDEQKNSTASPNHLKEPTATKPKEGIIRTEFPDYIEEKTCITDSNATSTEYITNHKLSNPAGAFFQNNNSILPTFTAYIRAHILPPTPTTTTTNPSLKYLIDAYCGSGLFTITLSALFTSTTGIDIAGASIASARQNAAANALPNATFHTADAAALFKEIAYPPHETVVIIDPPRKGCDEAFLSQLLRFGPRRVVYVSCNVHTQARDVGVLVEGREGVRFDVESLRGFDFFPQTGHVEGVAVLRRADGGVGD